LELKETEIVFGEKYVNCACGNKAFFVNYFFIMKVMITSRNRKIRKSIDTKDLDLISPL